VSNGVPSVHSIRGDTIRALRKLRRENPRGAYVFVTERGEPMSTIEFFSGEVVPELPLVSARRWR
jgi:hypothetical protein